MDNIQFFSEDTDFTLSKEPEIKAWLLKICSSEKYELENINYIFCTDEYLLDINKRYLNHDYYTDIITFDNSEEAQIILADIFISIDRIKDNASKMKISFEHELFRVLVHGLLHLLGFNDKSDDQKKEMRAKEDTCLSLLN